MNVVMVLFNYFLCRMNNLLFKHRHFLYSVLLILPTYFGFSVEYYLLLIASVFILEYKALFNLWNLFISAPFSRKNRVVWVVLFLMIFSLANKLYHGIELIGLKDYYASFYLFPFLILVGKIAFDKKMLKFFVFITLFEVFFAIAEYFVGVKTFFMDIGELNTITNYNLLYDSTVFGLSVNSSILALKILVAFILIDFVKFPKITNWVVRILLLAALLISFSRVVILVVLIYWAIVFLVKVLQTKGGALKKSNFQFYGVVLLLLLIFPNSFKNQFTRGAHQAESIYVAETTVEPEFKKVEIRTGNPIITSVTIGPNEEKPLNIGFGDKLFGYAENIQSSGRKLIWTNYLNYIEKNFLFGNGSDKLMFGLWVEKTESYKLVHAHNSYLMLLATNGVLISFLYAIIYLLLFKSKNFFALGAIFLYSLANYGVFWGFSYLDFIFLALLMHNFKPNYDN